jgi:carbonic anhydrase
MHLFEAILEANNRAVAGDQNAGLHPDDYAEELPVVALTCIDARLNRLFPAVLGVPEDKFIWLRNAGNIITGQLSSTMRSLALACAVKGGKEIAIIGHTDCQVGKTSTMQLLEKFKVLGIERHVLPDNINDYFGVFSSERQNVIKACDIVRHSPLIGPKVPVHGLVVDIQTGKLEWIVNGYEKWHSMTEKWNEVIGDAEQTMDKMKSLTDFQIGEMKFPDTKIGETVTQAADWLAQKVEKLKLQPTEAPPTEVAPPPQSTTASVAEKIGEYAASHWPKAGGQVPPPKAKRIPLPPPVRPRPISRSGRS